MIINNKQQIKEAIDNIDYGTQGFMLPTHNTNKSLFDNYYKQMNTNLDKDGIVYFCYKRDDKYRARGYHRSEGWLEEIETTLDEIYRLFCIVMNREG